MSKKISHFYCWVFVWPNFAIKHFDNKFVKLITKLSLCNKFISDSWLPNLFVDIIATNSRISILNKQTTILSSLLQSQHVQSNSWLLSYECLTNVNICILVVTQKSVEKQCWMKKYQSTSTRKRSIICQSWWKWCSYINVVKLLVWLKYVRFNVNSEFTNNQSWLVFHVVVSIYWLVKIWNLTQFPAQRRNGLLGCPSRI